MEENQAQQKYCVPNETPKVTIVLLVINVVLFVLEINVLKGNLWDLFGVGWGLDWKTEWYKLITAMFTHASVAHLGSNMIALYGAGMYLEDRLGSKRFLIYYLISGMVGEFLGCTFNALVLHREIVSIGASGAVFGLFGLLIVLSICGKLYRIPFIRVILFVSLTVAAALTETGIDIFGHAGGFVVGLVLGAVFCAAHREKKVDL